MKTYEIIDSHSHIYPEKIAQKAAESIGSFYSLQMAQTKGSPEILLEEGKEAGINRMVVCSVATKPTQAKSINNFIYEQIKLHPEFIGYMTLHRFMTRQEIKEEIELCVNRGFKGIKLHPDFQKFAIDADIARPIYEEASGILPILFHTGDKRYNYSHPSLLAKIAKEYPSLTCIGAHFGGWSEWEKVSCYKGLRNVYVDTSSSLFFIGPEEAKKFIDFFGAEWFFFGVDFPMWNAKEELDRFMSINLSEEERKMILAGNYKRVFKL